MYPKYILVYIFSVMVYSVFLRNRQISENKFIINHKLKKRKKPPDLIIINYNICKRQSFIEIINNLI